MRAEGKPKGMEGSQSDALSGSFLTPLRFFRLLLIYQPRNVKGFEKYDGRLGLIRDMQRRKFEGSGTYIQKGIIFPELCISFLARSR